MTHGRMLFQTLTWMAALGLLLFLPAGRLDWWQAWTFLAVMLRDLSCITALRID